ncbi:MAG: PAS domain-containing protein, partial [Clostridia bacterium]|nr:PAS domain-containing protein [Clostridia bacterium]
MNNTNQNIEQILSGHISGFHQYVLDEPAHLCYVSKNLCDMIGYTEQELLREGEDQYASLVHPADREDYAGFLGKLRKEEQSLTAQYRIIRKDGSVLFVSDTMTVSRQEDGILMGYSVLADITELKSENQNLRFLNETMPCGFLKYTCEKAPKITYINDQMLRFLRFPEQSEGEFDNLEMYKQN